MIFLINYSRYSVWRWDILSLDFIGLKSG